MIETSLGNSHYIYHGILDLLFKIRNGLFQSLKLVLIHILFGFHNCEFNLVSQIVDS